MNIQPITEDDLKELYKFLYQCWSDSYPFMEKSLIDSLFSDFPSWQDSFSNQLLNSPFYAYLMKINGAIVGSVFGEKPYIQSLYVHKNHRGKGIGKQLCLKAKSEGANRLFVLEKNTSAQIFYKKMGFEPTGKTKLFVGKYNDLEYELITQPLPEIPY